MLPTNGKGDNLCSVDAVDEEKENDNEAFSNSDSILYLLFVWLLVTEKKYKTIQQ